MSLIRFLGWRSLVFFVLLVGALNALAAVQENALRGVASRLDYIEQQREQDARIAALDAEAAADAVRCFVPQVAPSVDASAAMQPPESSAWQPTFVEVSCPAWDGALRYASDEVRASWRQ